jgi:hypothetical protein
MEPMKQTTVPMKNDAHLIIKTSADIMVEGTDELQFVAVVDDDDSFRMKDEDGVIYVRANSDAKLSVPRSVCVTIEGAGGDAALIGLVGRAEVQKVGGDLTLQNLKEAAVDSIGGDCYCKEVGGMFEIKRVGSDLDGHKLENVKATTVAGDIELSGITGAVELKADGDVRLQFNSAAISESNVYASGDIFLQVLPDAKALLVMKSAGEMIEVNACGQKLDIEQSESTLPLGEGGATINLTAGGDIAVVEGKETTHEFSFVFEDLGNTWKDFGKEIEEKIRESMKNVNHSLRHAGWMADEALQRATDKMQSKESKVYGFTFKNDGAPETAKAKKGVSDEERMMVLKMLQDKKISVEEAEKLLQALER